MKYSDLSNPTIVAKWFNTTPNNVRKTYMHNKPSIYEAQCISAYILESNITPEELEYAKKNLELKRKLCGK